MVLSKLQPPALAAVQKTLLVSGLRKVIILPPLLKVIMNNIIIITENSTLVGLYKFESKIKGDLCFVKGLFNYLSFFLILNP